MKGGTHEEVDMMAGLLCSFKALNIPTNESTLDEFVHVDDKNGGVNQDANLNRCELNREITVYIDLQRLSIMHYSASMFMHGPQGLYVGQPKW